jgi:hypothetical protein
MSFNSKKSGSLAVGAAILSIATAVHANHMQSQYFNDQSNFYINYAHESGANYHYGYDFSSPMAGASFTNLKTHHADFTSPVNTGICWEMESTQGDVSTMDTRFWYQNPSTSAWTSLNDDINGASNRFSRVRVWVYNTGLTVKVLPYSTDHNGKDLRLVVTKKPGFTEANCTTNSGLPWIKRINAGSATFGNNS